VARAKGGQYDMGGGRSARLFGSAVPSRAIPRPKDGLRPPLYDSVSDITFSSNVLRMLQARDDVEIVDTRPRYHCAAAMLLYQAALQACRAAVLIPVTDVVSSA
jgi:hypothetical protein